MDFEKGLLWTERLENHIKQGINWYQHAIDAGVCAEQARLFLPAYGMYVRWYWTASLQSVCHFINQRTKADAQYEIQLYAKAVYDLTYEHFPVSVKELIQ